MEAVKRIYSFTEGVLLRSHTISPYAEWGALSERQERRINVSAASGCTEERGHIELHALDSWNLRRTMAGAWVLDTILDAAALEAALER
jgi:sulfur relay (sulfurtransferase) complex TusBCD TusD component (DsrE family)